MNNGCPTVRAISLGITAAYTSLKTAEPLWHIWSKYYLWFALIYVAVASAAGFTAKLIVTGGFYAVVATVAIATVIYLTCRTYLRNIEMIATAAKAEEAERHIAELSHYIEEQQRIREQFSQIERMSALGELASGVAHDFNNTLAGILGRAQLLLETKDSEKIEKGLNIIIKTAKDGTKTVKRIQEFARQQCDHDFQLVDVRQLLFDVGEITRPRWENGAEAANIYIDLEIDSAANVMVMGDESELREVLVNMVFNAVDAMPYGGTLTMWATETSDAIEIAVSDTGIGMTEETRLRVFDPFFTTKGKTGMGLGLAVSYGIIRRHNATVDVETQLGIGTTFRMRLPIPAVRALAATQADTRLSGTSDFRSGSGQTRILVVDHDEHVRDLLRDILEKEGCEAVISQRGPT